MVINITTWSPDTCGCELSYTNDSENPEAGSMFYAVHRVCDEHAHLATKAKLAGTGHDTRSAGKFRIIEAAKTRNLEQHQDSIKRAHLPHHKRELEDTTKLINEHNAKVHTHFTEILAQPFAHDEHVYQAVLDENQTKNQAHGELTEKLEQAGYKDVDVKWELKGRAPQREIHLTLPSHINIPELARKVSLTPRKNAVFVKSAVE